MGSLDKGSPTIGVNRLNRLLQLDPFSPSKAWVISCHDLSHTQTPVNCSNNTCQSDTGLSTMLMQQANSLNFLTLRLSKKFRRQVDKQVLIQW